MIYRNDERIQDVRWLAERNVEAGEILRDFLAGERDLLEFEGGCDDAVIDLEMFLSGAEEKPICVERSRTGEILVRAIGSSESLLITGVTADVISRYLDQAPVWTADRADMTLRRRAQLM